MLLTIPLYSWNLVLFGNIGLFKNSFVVICSLDIDNILFSNKATHALSHLMQDRYSFSLQYIGQQSSMPNKGLKYKTVYKYIVYTHVSRTNALFFTIFEMMSYFTQGKEIFRDTRHCSFQKVRAYVASRVNNRG